MSTETDFHNHPGVGPARPNCHDCGVAIGEPHEDGCDTARCLVTGGQRFSCALLDDDDTLIYEHADVDDEVDCGQDVWTGYWPGDLDAARLGWWSQWVDGQGWVQCHSGADGAGPDLNRLIREAQWNRETQRWEASS